MSDRTVLVVGAHPDDEVLGIGGTLARHVDAGDEVHALIVTEGTTAQYDDESLVETKRREAHACAETLGLTDVHFGSLPDMRLDDIPHVEVNGVIESVVSRVDVGPRQTGRQRADNVISVAHDADEIRDGVDRCLTDDGLRQRAVACENPYDYGGASNRIVESLAAVEIDERLLRKQLTY